MSRECPLDYLCARLRCCGLTQLAWESNVEDVLRQNCSDEVTPERLVSLDIADNALSSVKGIELYSNLCSLNLARNQLTDILPQLLPAALTHLSLSSNQLTSLAAVAELAHLVWLDVSHNSLHSLADLRACKHLQHLDASHNQIARMAGLEEMFALQTLGLAHTLVQKELALRPLAMLPHLKHIKLARTPLVRRLTERRARLIVSNILPELRTMDDVAMPSTHGAYRGLKATASQEEAANHFGFGVQPLFDTAPAGPEAADSAQVQLDAAPKAALVALLGIAKESMDEAPGEGAAGLEAFLRDASENTHAMSCEEEVRSIFYDLSASQGTSARQSADGSQAGSQAAASVEQLWSSLNSSSPGKQPAGAALRPTLSKAASPAKHHKSPRALHKKQALLKARLSPPQHAPAGPLRSGTLETPRNIASAQAEQGQAFLAWSPARAREAMGWTSQTNSPRLSSMEMPSRSSSLQRSILKTATQQAADGSSGLALQVLSAHPDLALPSPDVYAQVVQLLSGAAGASAAQARHSSDSMPASVRVSESGFSPPYPRKQAAWQDQPDTYTTAQMLAAHISQRHEQHTGAHSAAGPAAPQSASAVAASPPRRSATGCATSRSGSDQKGSKAGKAGDQTHPGTTAGSPGDDERASHQHSGLTRQQTPAPGSMHMLRSPPRGLDQLSAEEERAGRPPQRQHSAMASPAPQEATYAGLSKAVSAPVDPNDFGQHPCTSDKPALLYYDQPVDADAHSIQDAAAAALLLTPPITPRGHQPTGPMSDLEGDSSLAAHLSPASFGPGTQPASRQQLLRERNSFSPEKQPAFRSQLLKEHSSALRANSSASQGAKSRSAHQGPATAFISLSAQEAQAAQEVSRLRLVGQSDKATLAAALGVGAKVETSDAAGDIFTQAAVDWAPGSGAAGEDDGLIKALKQAISYKRRNLEETHAY